MESVETMKELSNNCSETENIYTDIIEFDLGTEVEKLKEENGLLEDHIDSLKKDIDKLAEALQQLKTIQKNLAENISSLFLTAKMELKRKDQIIDNLQRELNDIIFRRDKKRRKSLCSSPVNFSKRGRYDNSYNSTDTMNCIGENNPNYMRSYEDKDSEKVGRDNELKNDNNKGWGSRVECRQYEHDEYKNTARVQPRSYGQNIDDKMKLQHRQENRSSNRDRYNIRDRNDNSYRTRRNVLNTPRTDEEHWIDEPDRKSGMKTEEEFGRCSSDKEQDVENECSRIPKVETMKLEKEPRKEKSNKSNTEKKKPVRKKLIAVQKLERELREKRALTSHGSSEDFSRNKTKSHKNKRGNYFVDHMDHIMDSVLLDINEAKIITISKKKRNLNDKPLTGPCHSYSEDEENSTMITRNQLSSFKNVPTISHDLVSELIDFKKDREKMKYVPYDDVKYNLPLIKTDLDIVSERSKQTFNENNIKKEEKTNEVSLMNNDIVSLNELPAQSVHVKIENSYLSKRKNYHGIEDERNLHIENVPKVENGVFELGEEGIQKENRKSHHQISSSLSEIKICQKLNQISDRETLEISSEECVKKNKSSESLCDSRSKTNHEKEEGNDISRTCECTDADNDKYVESQKNQKDGIENISKDNETARKSTDMCGKQDEQPTHDNTEAETETSLKCDPKGNEEINPPRKRKRKLTPSPTLPKLNSHYRIPKQVKKILESETSEKNNSGSEAQRNLVLTSIEDHKISYERTNNHTDSKNENFRKDRRKSVPRSFLREKLKEEDENMRSKSRERHSRSNYCEGQAEAGRQHHRRYITASRFRVDYQRDNYTRIKYFSRESLKGKRGLERRGRNREEEHIISEKNNVLDMEHSRIEKMNDSDLEDKDKAELTNIKANLCSERGRKNDNYSVMKETERIPNSISKNDHQTIFLEKEKDYNCDRSHHKTRNTSERKELPIKITETVNTASKVKYSVEKQGEILENKPAGQKSIASTNRRDAKIPDSVSKRNMQTTDGKEIIEEKFSHENFASSIKDSPNEQKHSTTDASDNSNVKNPLEASPLKTTEELSAVNKREKMNTTDSLNEMLFKPVSSKIKNDVIENSKKDTDKEKLGESAGNSSQKNKLEIGKLPIGNISKYSGGPNSTKKGSEEVITVPSIEERELKTSKISKIRNMPDIFSQEQIMPNLIPLKQTLPTDQHLRNSVTAKTIQLPNKDTIHYNSVQRELTYNKEIEGVIKEKEKHLHSFETGSLKDVSKVEESFDTRGAEKDSKNEKTESNLGSQSSSEVKIDNSNIPVIPRSSSYQKTIESSPLPAQTVVRKRITPIRVDDTALCSFENILVKNRMPSFVKDLSAPNSSPLSLTDEGDIPILHLEENFHVSNDDGTQKSFDRNIMNLLDTMNMSNLECDITKFQDPSEKDDRSSGASDSGPNYMCNKVLELSIEKQTLAPVVDDKSKGISESGPNHKSANVEVLEPSIEKQILAPVADDCSRGASESRPNHNSDNVDVLEPSIEKQTLAPVAYDRSRGVRESGPTDKSDYVEVLEPSIEKQTLAPVAEDRSTGVRESGPTDKSDNVEVLESSIEEQTLAPVADDRSRCANESGPNHKSNNVEVLEPSIKEQTFAPVADDKSTGASESGPNHKSDNVEVLEPSIEKQTLAPVTKADATLTPSTEPPVILTPVDTNNSKNESISGNDVQNSGDDLRTPTSNSRQNSMIGRRRSVRLVVINSV